MKKFYCIIFIIAACLTTSSYSFAQKIEKRTGFLKDSATQMPIVLASVTNLTTRETVMTSSAGKFLIAVKPKDILSFAAVGYYFDTLTVASENNAGAIAAFLKPLGAYLGNVTVSSKGLNRYQLDSIERRKEFLQGIANYMIPAVAKANSGAGIALNIDRFSKNEKKKRRAFAFYEDNENEAYINYRFTPELVASLTGFKDDELQTFMQTYRPSTTWLRSNLTKEDLVYYINAQLKNYKPTRNEVR
jgi:uncharacterized protein YxeA